MSSLLGIEFHNQLLTHLGVNFLAAGQSQHPAGEIGAIQFEPCRYLAGLIKLEVLPDLGNILGTLLQSDYITRLHQHGGNIHPAIIDQKMAMTYQVAGLVAR